MAFLLQGLDPALFAPWFALSDAELIARGARRVIAASSPGYPCRVSLADAEVGDELVLGPFEHHAVTGPYRASGPTYVRRAARERLVRDRVPDVLARRLVSVRAYDEAGMMAHADVVDGRELAGSLEGLVAWREVAYVHVHYAKPGCFACRVTAG